MADAVGAQEFNDALGARANKPSSASAAKQASNAQQDTVSATTSNVDVESALWLGEPETSAPRSRLVCTDPHCSFWLRAALITASRCQEPGCEFAAAAGSCATSSTTNTTPQNTPPVYCAASCWPAEDAAYAGGNASPEPDSASQVDWAGSLLPGTRLTFARRNSSAQQQPPPQQQSNITFLVAPSSPVDAGSADESASDDDERGQLGVRSISAAAAQSSRLQQRRRSSTTSSTTTSSSSSGSGGASMTTTGSGATSPSAPMQIDEQRPLSACGADTKRAVTTNPAGGRRGAPARTSFGGCGLGGLAAASPGQHNFGRVRVAATSPSGLANDGRPTRHHSVNERLWHTPSAAAISTQHLLFNRPRPIVNAQSHTQLANAGAPTALSASSLQLSSLNTTATTATTAAANSLQPGGNASTQTLTSPSGHSPGRSTRVNSHSPSRFNFAG